MLQADNKRKGLGFTSDSMQAQAQRSIETPGRDMRPQVNTSRHYPTLGHTLSSFFPVVLIWHGLLCSLRSPIRRE